MGIHSNIIALHAHYNDSARIITSMDREASENQILAAVALNDADTLALVDIRREDQMRFRTRIRNSVNIPNIGEALKMDDLSFEDKWNVKKPKEGQEIVLHCNTGRGTGVWLNKLESEFPDIWSKYSFVHVQGGVQRWNDEHSENEPLAHYEIENKHVKINL